MPYLCNPSSPEGFLTEKTAYLLDGKKKKNKQKGKKRKDYVQSVNSQVQRNKQDRHFQFTISDHPMRTEAFIWSTKIK